MSKSVCCWGSNITWKQGKYRGCWSHRFNNDFNKLSPFVIVPPSTTDIGQNVINRIETQRFSLEIRKSMDCVFMGNSSTKYLLKDIWDVKKWNT